jgi:molybdate transport repressor ModE-like protein
MRQLTPTTAWAVGDGAEQKRALDARTLPLLAAIARTGTLVAAARACGIPYRTAWGVLEEAGRDLRVPLVALARGRGATLTPLAQRWLAADESVKRAVDQAAVRVEIAAPSARAARSASPRLRIAASHDLALAQLKDGWRVAHAIALEFHGSAESLDALRAARVDVAGFHVSAIAADAPDPLLSKLHPTHDALLRFMTRTQGLIVARGNPRRVRGIEDLARRRMTIVNRQPGSGTRLLFDRLLAQARIPAETLAGYRNEEFTHAADAATVAAGRADAAFGIQAAAAQFGLAFVPLVTERYLFACRRRMLDSPRIAAFRSLLASAATRAVVTPLPGYALDAPGEPALISAG